MIVDVDGLPIKYVGPKVDSRQVKRRKLFQGAFAVVTEDYGKEPRKARRKMSRKLSKKAG